MDGSRVQGEPQILLWDTGRKMIPLRPFDPASFPMEKAEHWYDLEYAGWGTEKVDIPESPSNGPRGKRIVCLLSGKHPYLIAYAESAKRVATAFGVELTARFADWNTDTQAAQVFEAIAERPDMIILVPENARAATRWYEMINRAGIPVIAGNMMPEEEGFRYILAWTGPDDWGQFRMLARRFAELMNSKGGYCIVQHISGTSAYYARTWAVITELCAIAPGMKLLDMRSTALDAELTRRTVLEWIGKYDTELKGIVSADDNVAQIGINKAIEEADREDIIRVANGSSDVGFEFMKQGKLHAMTFQSAEEDGALSVKTAVDWFNGLAVEPLRYLPIHIITKDDVDDFRSRKSEIDTIDLKLLCDLVRECREEEVDCYFDSLYRKFLDARIITLEFFRGFSIEAISRLIIVIDEAGFSIDEILGDYETVFKNLFRQKTLELTLRWLRQVCREIIGFLRNKKNLNTTAQQIILYAQKHFTAPLSLKTLSQKFGFSPAYLGQVFKRETGKSFSNYLHELRIEKAKKLLLYTADRSNLVAKEVGYQDANYFYKCFKKFTGMYPSEFLQRNQ